MNMQPTELSPAELDAIRAHCDLFTEADSEIFKIARASSIVREDVPALLAHIAFRDEQIQAENKVAHGRMEFILEQSERTLESIERIAESCGFPSSDGMFEHCAVELVGMMAAELKRLKAIDADALAAKVARLEGERDFVRSLETTGGDMEHGTTFVQIDPRGVLVAAPFGAFIDKAMEVKSNEAN